MFKSFKNCQIKKNFSDYKSQTCIVFLFFGLTEVVLKLYLREVVIIAFEVFLKNSITIGSKCEKQENNTCL
jgi:hypothetical protein